MAPFFRVLAIVVGLPALSVAEVRRYQQSPSEMVFVSGDIARTEKPDRSVLMQFPHMFFLGQQRLFQLNEEQTKALNAYFLDRFEVRVSGYRKCVQAGVCSAAPLVSFHRDAFRSELPMVGVTWQEAQTYCTFVKKRLPTKMEWQHAAGATKGWLFPWGNQRSLERANWGEMTIVSNRISVGTSNRDGFRYAAAPGTLRFSTSFSGAMDMAGNVSEWVMHDGVGVLLGGSWMTSPIFGLNFLYAIPQQPRGVDVGFRCAKDA